VGAELGGGRREEAAAREDATFHVGEEPVAELLQSFHGVDDRPRWLGDLGVEDVPGGLDGGELQLFLGAEVRVEPALAHPDVRGEVADRDAFEAIDCGQVGRGAEDRLAAAFAVCS
jgi:hypothetical protein